MTTRMILSAALALVLAGLAHADDLADAAQGLCDTVKSCVLEQVSTEDMTPEMTQMMAPMLDNMCAKMRSQVKEVPVGNGLYAPAVGCMRSLESLSCAQLQSGEQASTPECVEYERLAREAGAASQ